MIVKFPGAYTPAPTPPISRTRRLARRYGIEMTTGQVVSLTMGLTLMGLFVTAMMLVPD